MAVNKEWWTSHLAEIKKSQRSMASDLNLDPASLVKRLNGASRLQLDEAVSIANMFNVDLDEVLVNFGILHQDDEHQKTELRGHFDATGKVTKFDKALTVKKHYSFKQDNFAHQFQIEGGMDGWVFYFENEKSEPTTNVAAVICSNNGDEHIGFLRRGYVPGEYRVLSIIKNDDIKVGKIIGMHKMIGAFPPE